MDINRYNILSEKEDYENFYVRELKEKLIERGLKTGGKRYKLIERLNERDKAIKIAKKAINIVLETKPTKKEENEILNELVKYWMESFKKRNTLNAFLMDLECAMIWYAQDKCNERYD